MLGFHGLFFVELDTRNRSLVVLRDGELRGIFQLLRVNRWDNMSYCSLTRQSQVPDVLEDEQRGVKGWKDHLELDIVKFY